MDYSAVGQTTNLAARMEHLAPPGRIRLTAATCRLAEGLVQVNTLGRFPLKGLTEPVEVLELVGASTIRRCLQASAARSPGCRPACWRARRAMHYCATRWLWKACRP
jgi:class 3 adenylate cyclase